MQPTYVLGQGLNAVGAQEYLFGFRKVTNIRSVDSQLIEIQTNFFQTIKFHNPSWNMTNLVTFQIECFQMLAATDVRGNVGQLAIRQIKALDAIVFWEINFAETASVEGDNF
jgi:hypothetical protein